MSFLYITEFAATGLTGAGTKGVPIGTGVPIPADIAVFPSITTQKVDFGATSVASAAFNSNTRLIRVHTDGICHITYGETPVATTSHMRFSQDNTEYFSVSPGMKLAAITGV